MAIIHNNQSQAEVNGVGEVMSASVNFSGALMEMLATVYSYILMAAIREAIQNACDASRRAGLSFAEGVMVTLPTPSNPMITVTDRGAGMTKEFMTSTYLSFGSSTKSSDNGAAGGLGVGRWAAYGYIRECYISTCHESDMVERTYFQFQGASGTPQVQLASEVPGTVPGTKVYFPIKESDLGEALRAVAWLKEVMQLTMGDSFSVDTPARLSQMLPPHSGHVLDLGDTDSSLAGVRIYPMMGQNLKYSRSGLVSGSLLVLTNQDAQVGGLPFHVNGTAGESVFWAGMVIEVPMRFNVPFMPSREEIKYTDEVDDLLKRIDRAAHRAAVATAKALYAERSLASKAKLSNLLGNEETWHSFSFMTRRNGRSMHDAFRLATGGVVWRGQVEVPYIPEFSDLRVRHTSVQSPVLRQILSRHGVVCIPVGKDATPMKVTFAANEPLKLVINDVPANGDMRFRAWLASQAKSNQKFLYITAISKSQPVSQLLEAAAALNAEFGGGLLVVRTSEMPEVARTVVGSKVVSSTSRGALAYHCCKERKQLSEVTGFDVPDTTQPIRLWIEKRGSQLSGFVDDFRLSELTQHYQGDKLKPVLSKLGATRLYLLSPKQVGELQKAVDAASATPLWDAQLDELDADDADVLAEFDAVQALKSWVPFEAGVEQVLASDEIQKVFQGEEFYRLIPSWTFRNLCSVLKDAPRMTLTGTKFDKRMKPHIDLLTGALSVREDNATRMELRALCESLIAIGQQLEVSIDAPAERKVFVNSLIELGNIGTYSYEAEWEKLLNDFPLVEVVGKNAYLCDAAADHFCTAIAKLYG